MSVILPSTPGLAIRAGATEHEKLGAVARQFEAVFVRQMLAAARKTDFGGDEIMGSQAMDTFRQLQDEHFADVTAQTGALGLAKLIEAQMARFVTASPTTTSTNATSADATSADAASTGTSPDTSPRAG